MNLEHDIVEAVCCSNKLVEQITKVIDNKDILKTVLESEDFKKVVTEIATHIATQCLADSWEQYYSRLLLENPNRNPKPRS